MKNFIKNKIREQLMDEDYPSTWSIEEFKKLKSFNSRVKYCGQNLQRISSGSARIVYKIDEIKVLKLAKNKKGLAQNDVEISFGDDSYLQDIVAKLFDSDEDGLWVEMEVARKVTPKIFNNVIGETFEDFCSAIMYQYKSVIRNWSYTRKPDVMDRMWENEFTADIIDYMINYQIPAGDLCRLNSYGLVNRDGKDTIVLIDYGLTGEVYDSYYM